MHYALDIRHAGFKTIFYQNFSAEFHISMFESILLDVGTGYPAGHSVQKLQFQNALKHFHHELQTN